MDRSPSLISRRLVELDGVRLGICHGFSQPDDVLACLELVLVDPTGGVSWRMPAAGIVKLRKTQLTDPQDNVLESRRELAMLGIRLGRSTST